MSGAYSLDIKNGKHNGSTPLARTVFFHISNRYTPGYS